MHQLVDEGIVVLKEANRLLLDDSTLAAQLQDYIVKFDPVCELINKCHASDCTSADAAELWLSLHIPVNDDAVDNALDARLAKVLQPIALAANFVHPRYRGQKFSHSEEFNSKVEAFLEEELGDGPVAGLQHYKNKTGKFDKVFKKNIECPKAFWHLMEAYYPILSKVALKLLNIPSSSAQIERLFSHWAFIHSDIRNRLSVERSMKLVAIYYAFKMQDINNDYASDDGED